MAASRKRFNVTEDTVLSRAWVNVSENSSRGSDMKSVDFWTAIAAAFNQLRNDEPPDDGSSPIHCEYTSLMSR